MTVLSILCKTYALIVWRASPVSALVLWFVGLLADVHAFRRTHPLGSVMSNVLWVQAGTLLLGFSIAAVFSVLAVNFKTGIPPLAQAQAFLLNALNHPAAAFGGNLHVTTMAGALTFPVNLDTLGLLIPLLVAGLSMVYLLRSAADLRSAFDALAWILLILMGACLARALLSLSLFLSLCDFVGYETEELPLVPFREEGLIAWSYLPFLLAAWPLLRERLDSVCGIENDYGYLRTWPVWIAVTLLLMVSAWPLQGQVKQGKLLINTYHTQWSRTDRPYDREWYGADSGYNYATLKRLYEQFFDVQELRGPIRAEDLAEASVLFIYAPDRQFGDDERRAILSFVRNGGGIMLVGDHTNVFGSTSHLNELAETLGFIFRDDVLFDLDEDFFQLMDISERASPFLHGMQFFKLRGPASIKSTSPFTRSVMEIGHSKSLRAIYSVNNFYPPPYNYPKMTSGRFCVAAASQVGRGRVLAFADSTVFSNFELFYPGKYEFLLNGATWLNHSDGAFRAPLQRGALVVALVMVLYLLLRTRQPRALLATMLGGMVIWIAVHETCSALERARTELPVPVRPSRWVFFAADPEDRAYVLRDFTSDAPYERKYDIFIQWVLRTSAFSGFYVTGSGHREGLYEKLVSAEHADTALAFILRDEADAAALGELAGPVGESKRLLVMFSSTWQWEDVAATLKSSDLLFSADDEQRVKEAYPAGDVVLASGGRRILVVFNSEAFSDRSMGFSEKIDPNETQRAQYDKAFALIDKLFGE